MVVAIATLALLLAGPPPVDPESVDPDSTAALAAPPYIPPPREVAGEVAFAGQGEDAGDWGADSYQLLAARIEGRFLKLKVAYGGGCEKHEFTLVFASVRTASETEGIRVVLAHEANGDRCEAWLTTHVSIDLTPASEAIGEDRTALALRPLIATAKEKGATPIDGAFMHDNNPLPQSWE